MPRLLIKTKFMAVIAFMVLGFVAFNAFLYPKRVERQIRRQSERNARQVVETASFALGSAVAKPTRESITLVLGGVKTIPSFRFSAVYDELGHQIDATPSTPFWARDYSNNGGLSRAFTRPGDGILVATAPVFFREGDQDRVGALVLGFTTEDIQEAVQENVMVGLWVGAAALVTGLGLTLFLERRYLRPIGQLTQAAREVAQGNLEGVAVQVRSRDELEDLSRSFEVMTHRLRTSRDEIERQKRLLEHRVQERTRQLMEAILELEEVKANLEQTVQERTRNLELSQKELKARNLDLERTRHELEAWTQTLEEKVRSKTQELTELNESLLASFQKLQQVDRLKDDFLANMSHELRTPLNAVIGFSGLLLQETTDRLPEDVKEDLRVILDNGRSLLAMIDSILDLSKIEAGRFDLEQQVIDPLPLLEDVCALAPGLILDRPIRFVWEHPALRVRIQGDPLRFKQALQNLLDNAIKFTEAGKVEVRASREGRLFRVEFMDTGLGMTSEEIRRLFRPFQQVDGSITRRFGGAGLGLTISQRLIGLMGGEVTVRSEKGRGSTFTVEIPIQSQEAV